ncbi:ABC transporter ATP-binding protein [Sneathiella chinensis]|uniref:ABC transporter ATP-binding protein n=1 Tax=Sneathiella chinensis TaxID=349750 RepID=A0ABQ5U1I9_9PROT|nr:ABC transporter ATP-binding protein [Sneathiella chinensis]GLQ05540.1 ABC transporter ATP-binding protein [Sneathiella chinensis]
MSLLVVRVLAKAFGGVQAVKDVSFHLEAGEMLALIGPNGAGKSTCFNMLNGQLAADKGSVLFDGRELIGQRPRDIWRLGVGRTFQITATFASMTVRENVQMALLSHHGELFSFWRRASHRHGAEADRLLDRVGMLHQADRACGVLAYGDLKRLELAVALANGPRLLLMDEPTAGMAPKERVALMELVAGIAKEEQVSVLFTEHDMDVVFAHSDRLMVLNRGEIIATGSADDIRSNDLVKEVYLGGGTTFDTGREMKSHA